MPQTRSALSRRAAPAVVRRLVGALAATGLATTLGWAALASPAAQASDDATVSKTHALLEPTPEGLAVTDLGSTNGTYLVDFRGSHELAPGLAETVPRGGAIYFGEAECRVR